MKRTLLFVILLLTVVVAAPAKDFSSEILHVNSAGFPRIAVTMKVFNKELQQLQADNFVISEDKTGISSFELVFQKNKHYMVLVIDRSSSIEPAMNQVKQAAAGFVNSMVGDVSLAVLSFGSDLDINHSFSEDGQSLVDAIAKIRPWGGTALYDALYSACEELENKAGRADLKTVVCLTDGRDSTPNGQTPMSTHTPAEVNKFATEKGIRLITVGLGADIDEAVLKGFAGATGGWYLQTTTPEQLSKLYEALGRRMKLERYYQLSYRTPKSLPDGTRREIEIASTVKGFKDQGKGHYNAPARTVSKPEPSGAENGNSGGKMSVSMLFSDLKIAGPDMVFLTGPIIPPPVSPVHSINGAAFVGLSPADCQMIIDQARVRVSEDHRQNYERQHTYLVNYQQGLERLLKIADEQAGNPGLKDFEKPRIEYRRQYLQLRLEEVNLIDQEAYENYLVRQTASMDDLDYYQRTRVAGNPEEDDFYTVNAASESAALRVVEARYEKLLDQLRAKMDQHFNETLDSRGSHVEHSTTEVVNEVDLPSGGGRSGIGAVPSIGNIKDYIENKIPGSGNSDDDDEDNGDDAVSDIPELEIIDR